MQLSDAADPELWRHVLPVAKDAFQHITSRLESGFSFERHSQFPRLEPSPNDFPNFGTGTGPRRLRSIFGPPDRYGTEVAYEELDRFSDLLKYVRELPDEIQDFLVPAHIEGDSWREHILTLEVADLALAPVERHLHTAGPDWDEESVFRSYVLLEAWWFGHDKLSIELFVPILGVSFEVDKISLDGGATVERMDEEYQLARWPSDFRSLDHASAMACATHALVVPGFAMRHPSALASLSLPDSTGEHDQVTRFFAALTAVARVPTGYAQVLSRPIGWSDGFRAHLPAMNLSRAIAQYPPELAGGPKTPTDRLGFRQVESLRALNGALETAPQRLQLAAERLLAAQIREDESDRLIDLCVALEALVGDREPGELNYKLRVRAAAVLAPEFQPQRVFAWIRDIYSLRSRVVHGSRVSAKHRKIWDGDSQVPTDVVADEVVRELLTRLLRSPELDAARIDQRLLAGLQDSASLRD